MSDGEFAAAKAKAPAPAPAAPATSWTRPIISATLEIKDSTDRYGNKKKYKAFVS
jgi:hypothetical protein